MENQKSKIKNQNRAKSLKLFALSLALLFTLCSLRSPQAYAEGISLGINPPIIAIEANPPANMTTPITLENKSDETVRLAISFRRFTSATSDDGKIRYLPHGSTNASFFRRVQLLENNRAVTGITLSPQQQKALSLHLGIPKNEPARDYYFSIVFLGEKTENTDGITGNQTTITGGIATNILVSIGPKGKTSAVLQEFSVPSFLTSGPVPFTVLLKNTSNHVISPSGEILIKDIFGQTVGKISLLPVNILSQTSRYIPDTRQSYLQSTKDAIPAAIWNENFLLGFYRAQINLTLSEKGPMISREVSFFAFPVILFAGLVILVGIILLIRARLRSRLGKYYSKT
ncbi:MAG: hypothetical protein HY431_02180 [Candidatus Levybacteria bacterium]|nr:hypothetical protein [Candidatus Levybacteria bacterium]